MKESAKKFYCEFPGCDKAFNRRDYLERHAVNHLAIKPFFCRQCKRHFSRKDLYDNHLNTRFHAKRLEELVLASSTRMKRHRPKDMANVLEDQPEYQTQQERAPSPRFVPSPVQAPAASELAQPLLPLNDGRSYADCPITPPEQDTYWGTSMSPSTFAARSPTELQANVASSTSQSPKYLYENNPVEIPNGSFARDFNVNVFASLNGGPQPEQYFDNPVFDTQEVANEMECPRTWSNVSEPSLVADDWNCEGLDQPETPSEYLSTTNVYLGSKKENLLFDELAL